jgi:pilus assembly protein CpaE
MTKTISIVVLSAGIESFKEIRQGLSGDDRTRLLAGGNDADQLHDEIVRLKPAAALITLDSNPEQAVAMIKRLATERPGMTLISAARSDSSDLILRSLRAGARDFLRLPIVADALKTVLDRALEFSRIRGEEKGRMISVFSSKAVAAHLSSHNLARHASGVPIACRSQPAVRRPAAVSRRRSEVFDRRHGPSRPS